MCDMNATTPRLYDPRAETLTEQGRFALYMLVANKVSGTSGYIRVDYADVARALGLELTEGTRHAIEQAAWSLHGERRGEFRLIKVKDTNPRGYPLDKGFVALLRVAPSRLREHGFIKFADIYERYGVYGREIS